MSRNSIDSDHRPDSCNDGVFVIVGLNDESPVYTNHGFGVSIRPCLTYLESDRFDGCRDYERTVVHTYLVELRKDGMLLPSVLKGRTSIFRNDRSSEVWFRKPDTIVGEEIVSTLDISLLEQVLLARGAEKQDVMAMYSRIKDDMEHRARAYSIDID